MRPISTPVALVLVLLFSGTGLIAQKSSSKEIEKVKAAIEKETKAFFEIDLATWKDSWVHEGYAFWSFADTTDVNSFSGWEAIENGFSEYFKSSSPSKAKIKRKWINIRVNGNLAYARFSQWVDDNIITRGEQNEVRVLEKRDGVWKIVHVGVITTKRPNF